MKKAIRVIGLLWILCYFLMIGGCGKFKGVFTTPVVYQLKELASPMNEFTDIDTPSHKKIQYVGSYIGIVELKGKEWRKYQFPRVLSSPDRVLEILVGNRNPESVIVREASVEDRGIEQALLFDHCFCGDCVAKMSYKKHNLYTNALGSDDYISLVPKRLNGNHYSAGFTVAGISLKWIDRSRISYASKLSKLLYTVPLDIIALPAQPFFYALYQL